MTVPNNRIELQPLEAKRFDTDPVFRSETLTKARELSRALGGETVVIATANGGRLLACTRVVVSALPFVEGEAL